jgi:hypothetical protein
MTESLLLSGVMLILANKMFSSQSVKRLFANYFITFLRTGIMKTFEVDIECKSCGGTGLYVGLAERDGAAMVCSTCKGTGKYHHKFTYKEFKERTKRKDVRRVFKTSCGFVHTPDDTEVDGKTIKFSQSGVSYEKWLNGGEPLPLKTLYCPKMWTGQKWDSKTCTEHCLVGDSINHCPYRENMAACWDEYENSKD